MKNVDERYEKYYNAYKNDYDNDDELKKKINKKNFDYKQFELFDETDKKLKLDAKQRILLKRLKIKKKVLINMD